MKIIIINGSPRKKGATAKILYRMQKVLSKHKDMQVEIVHLADLTIGYCKGCGLCFQNGTCMIEDDGEKLVKKLQEADGVILGSPTYASNVSGQMKVFIDRAHLVMEQALRGKYGIVVATGENYGNRDAASILKKWIQYSGGIVCQSIVRNIPFSEDIEDDKRLQRQIKGASEKLYESVSRRKLYPVQNLFCRIVFYVGIRPFVLKKGKAYMGVKEKWDRHV
ncbi:MAG: flavodoxin family protein [Roseburia sp.]|nr:flavodoxin family protein [Roseburia sp.]MCM1279696.1 flavodoxin family protein [Robinsoniella sp.]